MLTHNKGLDDDFLKGKGHPRWYGRTFDMNDSTTWDVPDTPKVISLTLRNGRICHVLIEAWHNLFMRCKCGLPMHEHPFTFLRIIQEIGIFTSLTKLRGRLPGRAKGYLPGRPKLFPVVIQGGKGGQKQARAP